MEIKACIFDLDGVIVDTAKYHYSAWRRMANELGFDFSEAENEKLKGVSRRKSLEIILSWGGIEMEEATKQQMTDRKNEWYVEHILKMTADEILDGVVPFLTMAKVMGMRIGLGSASKNARTIIDQVGLTHFFDAFVDGTRIPRGMGKPNPLTFQLGTEELGVLPSECIVFEDAEKGVTAALDCGCYAVGIGAEDVLGHAHLVLPNFKNTTLAQVLNDLEKVSLKKSSL